MTKEEVDILCDPFDDVKLGRLTPQESERRGGGTFRVSSTGEHAWEINFPLPDHVENILCWIDQAKECSRQLNQKQPKTEKHQHGVVYRAIVDGTIVDKIHLLEVIPPTVKSAHLKAFVGEAYTKLKCTINEKFKQLQEMEKRWWWMMYIWDYDSRQQTVKHLHAMCDDLRSDLQSLYQWVCKEDKEISQELAPVDLLLQLLEWLSRITSYLIEDARRGSFRNLLLDGWWLDFWEVILLAAGDVERNPGPRQITGKPVRKI